ncbi:hypothetical protein [Streptomyces bobili]|uniref:hypothetical protein n=1 Tax=Streptomyces bobili TaxID=67280 RepID=UPI003715964B
MLEKPAGDGGHEGMAACGLLFGTALCRSFRCRLPFGQKDCFRSPPHRTVGLRRVLHGSGT